MDTGRFDFLTKVVGAWATRRRALSLLAALGNLGLIDADAAKSGKCKPKCDECEKCKKGKCKPKSSGTPCTVPSGGMCCGGRCVDPRTDETDCGTCGNVCTATQVCQEGSCFPRSSCPATQTSMCTPITVCGSGVGDDCLCAQSAEGNILCLDVLLCIAILPCATSADCPPGEACVDISECCGRPPGSMSCVARCPEPTT